MFCDENYKATNSKKNQRFLTIMRSYEKNGWCPGEDSNLHGLHHTDLNRARLPIPPPGPRRRTAEDAAVTGMAVTDNGRDT